MKRVQEQGTLQITKDLSKLDGIYYIFVCVGTPQVTTGRTDLSQLWGAVEELAPYLPEQAGFIIKDTVPVGTADDVQAWFDQRNQRVEVISYPEFLREGKTMEDVRNPTRIILGGHAKYPRLMMLRRLLAQQTTPIMVTTRKNAEMMKYAANAFLATKISFINQIAQLCEAFDTDIQTIARGIGLDPRIGQAFLGAGIGFGGPSLPKDLTSLISQAEAHQIEAPLLHAVNKVNQQQRDWVIAKLSERLGELKGKRLAVWGVTFKGGTENIRNSVALTVIEKLSSQGATLHIYDPYGMERLKRKWEEERFTFCGELSPDLWKAVELAEALIILTDWQEFKEADLLKVKKLLKSPLIIDGRNLYYPEMMREQGFEYVSVGRKV